LKINNNQVFLEISAESAINNKSQYMDKWCYEFGLILKAFIAVWEKTGDIRYFNYIKRCIDRFVDKDGNIKSYNIYEYNLDNINPGKVLLFLYKETKDIRYKKAALNLRTQLLNQPRNMQGGFWHKYIYPHQMWLDGIYMGFGFLI